MENLGRLVQASFTFMRQLPQGTRSPLRRDWAEGRDLVQANFLGAVGSHRAYFAGGPQQRKTSDQEELPSLRFHLPWIPHLRHTPHLALAQATREARRRLEGFGIIALFLVVYFQSSLRLTDLT